jgi:hypothetical protein
MIPTGDDPEKDSHERAPKGAQKPTPPKAEPPKPEPKGEDAPPTIGEPKQKLLYIQAHAAHAWTREQVKAKLLASRKYTSSSQITEAEYDKILTWFKKNKPPVEGGSE